jgi:hypothetical protein
MKPTRKLTRRSFSKQVVGTAIVGGAFAALGGRALAQGRQTGLTDQDSGSNSDNACEGRGGPGSRYCGNAREQPEGRYPTGITDRDSGSNSDNAGYGRGGPGSYRSTGVTDADPGDPVGGGRGGGPGSYTGRTDSDSGSNSDNAGQGRVRPRSCSDSDGQPNRDPIGQGRRC